MRLSSRFTSSLLRWGAIAALFGVLVLLMPTLALAQSTGTLTGTVYDQTGAVLPDAHVTLINSATQEGRNTVTNSSGYFSFGILPPATYRIIVTAAGFKSAQKKDIIIRPGDVRSINDIALEVGAKSEVVEVTGVAGEVAPVDSGERSAVVTSEQLHNLALVGRDATELIRTLPGFAVYNGASVNNQAQDFTTISVGSGAVGNGYIGNGAPYRGGTDLITDGAHILDSGCNCGSTQTVNGDMVSEVKVQVSNFGADSAKGPIVINAVGKSGTTAYHGEAYLHARDASMNALDWSFKKALSADKSGLTKAPADRYLFPGGSIGGPVPFTHKKLLFWTGFEYYKQQGIMYNGGAVPGMLGLVVPTMSMRGGDFSMAAADNAAFCGVGPIKNSAACGWGGLSGGLNWVDKAGVTHNNSNIIPASEMDPGAMILMNNVPKPNFTPTELVPYNLLVPEFKDQNGWMYRARADYLFNTNNQMYVTYNTQKQTDQEPVHLWWYPYNSIPFPGGLSSHDNSQTLSGHYMRVFSPTMTNDLAVGFAYINYPLAPNNKEAWNAAANNYPYQGVFKTNSKMMPSISNGYWVTGIPFMNQYDIFSNGGSFVWKKWNLSVEDNLTKAFGTHTLKTGFYYERTTNDQGPFSALNGDYQFTGTSIASCYKADLTTRYSCGASNAIANMVLGVANGFSQVNVSPLDNLWYPTYSGYVQDSWKVTKRLTLQLGLRAEHLGDWRPFTSTGVAAYTGKNTSTFLPGFDWHGRNASIPLTGRDVQTITWEPRLGFAWDVFGQGKTVVRGGWGEYAYRDQWNLYSAAVESGSGVRNYNTPGPMTLATIDALGRAGGASGALSSSANGVDFNDHHVPMSRNWNVTVSVQTPASTLFEIAYVGSQTIYQPMTARMMDLNVIPLGAGFAPGASNYNGGAGCSTPPCNIGSFNTSLYPLSANYSNSTVNVLRHRGESNYNGLQASWQRTRGRITYNLNYTWSKALGLWSETGNVGTGNAIDATNLHHNYGVLPTDRSHVFNFSYTFSSGTPIKNNSFLAGFVNDWNLSGITTWQSGPNLQASGNTNFGLGGNGPADPVSVAANPNDPTKWTAVPINSTNYLGTATTSIILQPQVTCDPTANLAAHQFINGNCFTVAPAGTQGTWMFPYIHGPAFFNSDLSVFKTFKITERHNVEIRASAFNFLNHPLESFNQSTSSDRTLSFNYIGNGCGASGQPVCLNGSGKYVLQNATAPTQFGQTRFGYASTKFGRRVVELSLRYSF